MEFAPRKFGYCKVNWKIENLSIAVFKTCWEIVSPEFYVGGLLVTKWKMMLKSNPKKGERNITFALKRLECGVNFPDNPGNAYVNFSLNILCYGYTYLYNFPIIETCLGVNSVCEVELGDQYALHCAIQFFRRDVLDLDCELIVYFDISEINFDSCECLCFKQLSQDLLTLLGNGVAHDVELGNHNMNIQAHIPILCSRSEFFTNEIEENPNRTRFDCRIVQDSNSLKAILAFVYTGNIEFVLSRPSISIQRFAAQFCLSEIILWYVPDQLFIYSTISSDDYYFYWDIHDVLSRPEYHVESPLLIMGETDIIWKLKIYTRCCQYNEECIVIIAEIVEGKTFMDIFPSFTLGKHREFFYPKRSLTMVNGKEIITYENFIKHKILIKYLEAGDLTINYRFRISSGKRYTSVDRSHNTSTYAEQRYYDTLYENLQDLYDESFLGDAVIVNGTEYFSVHKCILAARSPTIYNMIAESGIIFLNIRTDVLNELLHFLYTAKFRNARIFIILELYKISHSFNINCLKKACSEILQEDTTVKTV